MVKTIYALSSGPMPSAVAVLRLSGPAVRAAVSAIAGPLPPPRRASLRPLRNPATAEIIDRGLVLYLPGPGSFTGEDMAEFQVHGSRAVVAALLDALAALPGLAAAEPGDFTRRAFENGRLDLTAVEGLGDLIAAETEAQRRQALRMADGALARRAEHWREALLDARAAVEADLDFADEGDVPDGVAADVWRRIGRLRADMLTALADADRGERVRDGIEVALMGPPNAGKSSLLNALAQRDVAIVTDEPGTTRDILEVRLDLAGQAVILCDTAGLRAAAGAVEQEGIRRARQRGRRADLVIWLDPDGAAPPADFQTEGTILVLRSKSDLGSAGACEPAAAAADASDPTRLGFPSAVSVRTGAGLPALVAALEAYARGATAGEPALLTHVRQRECVRAAAAALDLDPDLAPELIAEALRRASEEIGRLVGRVDVEDVLGAIFARFCIGK